ncbi:MAG: DUF2157 domain-containing protein [Verrucomicrobia bacterium]|nr:DUF2157 domain-containing protein [Cytophagales bacterium]
MTREDIHLISKHSNWSESGVEQALKANVYNNSQAWKRFLKLFFMGFGVCFTALGIIFFFAYNWNDLPKFVKIGMTEVLIITTTALVLFSKINTTIKNIILTGTSVLVGALFAVFGQVYQTGASAYDFFLGWTVFITLWVIVSNFAPLWLVFLTLLNTTFILYAQQVAHDWSQTFVYMLLFIGNTLFLIVSMQLSKLIPASKIPVWFASSLALACVSFTTLGIINGIFETRNTAFWILIFLTSLVYVAGIRYGLKTKSVFYLALIPFSIIIIVSALLLNLSNEAGMLLLIGLFIVGSVTLLIKILLDFQKKWTDEK